MGESGKEVNYKNAEYYVLTGLLNSIDYNRLILKAEVIEAATGGVLWKKVFFKISQISQEKTCIGVFLMKLQTWDRQLCQKETPTEVFSYEIWEFFKNTYFEEHPRTAAS